MILYFDVYIIDSPFLNHTVKSIKYIREGKSIFKMPSKLDITKYTLESYKIFPWTKVIIKFDVAKEEDREPFHKFVRETFPEAIIIDHRSDTQEEYCKTIEEEILNTDDEWIFFSPNNDHPMITTNIEYLYKLLYIAQNYKKKYDFVSIIYTMFSEYNNVNSTLYFKDAKIIEDSEQVLVISKPKGLFISGQILHKDLLRYMFFSHYLDGKITRLEDIEQRGIIVTNQVVLSPKREICAHFDGHSNTYGIETEITPDQVPPLFIPPGFFDRNIKIRYGYNIYREGYVNINPSKKYYSFRNKKDITDLKVGIRDLPMFWLGKISVLDINSFADHEVLLEYRDKYYSELRNPWQDPFNMLKLKIKSFLYNKYVLLVIFLRSVLNK